ncbi:methyltransferase domain-containing protein [Micromonospora ureilytica]|uniref:class I SAM-dependent methyltransferase n=1 Tax=Micromonospora ureilytica TaxID=709868 RepID=UPI0033D14C14
MAGNRVALPIEERVELLRSVFDTSTVVQRSGNNNDVVQYYEQSAIGYAFFHSRDGAIHMALNPDGIYDQSGYQRQPDLIARELGDQVPEHVLELGCGKGYNLKLLARRWPEADLLGIDITRTHVLAARRELRSLTNVYADVGDFLDTGLAAASFDLIYSIESLCHATDLPKALREVRRLARKDAYLIVIDAWRTDAVEKSANAKAEAAKLTEKAMAVGHATTQSEWLKVAKEARWRHIRTVSLNAEVMPNLVRFEAMSERFLRHRFIARTAKSLVRSRLLENAIAGYLMAQSLREGLHTYDMIVLQASRSKRDR